MAISFSRAPVMRFSVVHWLSSIRLRRTYRSRPRARRYSCLTAESFETRLLLDGNVTALIDAGSLVIRGDDANNTVEVDLTGGNIVVRGLQGTTVNGKTGDQILITGSSKITNDLEITLGRGNDTVVVNKGIQVGRDLIIEDTRGASTIGIVGVTIGNDLLVTTGKGNDAISISDATIGDGIAIHTGEGNDQIAIENTTTKGSITIVTYRGDDDAVIQGGKVGEDLNLRMGAGNDDVVVQNATIVRNLIVQGKAGADFVVFDTLTVSGRTAARLNGGADTFVTQGKNTFTGLLTANGGAGGNDTVSISTTTTTTAGRSVSRFENTTIDAAVVNDRLNNAKTGILTMAESLRDDLAELTGDTVPALTITTNALSNANTIQSSGTLVTETKNFVITGKSAAGATIGVDADGDGQFDDGTTTANAGGDYTITVPLAVGQQQLALQAALADELATQKIDVRLVQGTVVRFNSNVGNFDVELFDAPTDANSPTATIENFLGYLPRYANSIIHRSIDNFVIQGGAVIFQNDTLAAITTDPPIANEFNAAHPNVRGTISMALPPGNPQGGTSQWFINTRDNLNLNTNQHTVFGQVIGTGMEVVDSIDMLNTFNMTALYPPGVLPLAETPARNYSGTTRQITGLVSVAPGATLVTGTGTNFDGELFEGQRIIIGSVTTTIVDILSDTEVTIADPHGPGAVNVTAQTDNRPTRDQLIVFNSISVLL